MQTGDWSLINEALTGGPNPAFTYGFIYLPTNWNNYSVQAKLQFPAKGFAAGLSGRLNSNTGARYAVYVYTENDFGGPAIKLLKFSDWKTFGYNEVTEFWNGAKCGLTRPAFFPLNEPDSLVLRPSCAAGS